MPRRCEGGAVGARAVLHIPVELAAAMAWERPAKCPRFGMRLTILLAVTASILAPDRAGAAVPVKKRAGAPVARSLAGNEIGLNEDRRGGTGSDRAKGGAGADSSGPCQILAGRN